jgi:hypothetical protein
MLYKRSDVTIVALVLILVFAGNVKDSVPANPVKPYQYTVPEATNDGWKSAHVSGENIDADVLKDLFERVINETYKNIHSVLLVKNGKLVVEEYFPRQFGEGQEQALKRVTIH